MVTSRYLWVHVALKMKEKEPSKSKLNLMDMMT